MQILHHEWFNVGRADEFRLYPLGDIHLGSRKCDEQLLNSVVDRIAADDHSLWLGMGDFADFINRMDPRFDPGTLAEWVTVADLIDLAAAQLRRLLGILNPIADKCIGMVEGNHERMIRAKFERDIYAELVSGIKAAAHRTEPLGLGMTGWIVLNFYRSSERERETTLTINVHHGFGGGRLAGGKALSIQRWLWTHDADICIFGHSHNTTAQPEAVEAVAGDRVVSIMRRGVYSGTFYGVTDCGPDTYEERKGYLPMPLMQPVILLRPGREQQADRVRVIV